MSTENLEELFHDLRRLLGYGSQVAKETLVAAVRELGRRADAERELTPIKREALALASRMRALAGKATIEDAADALDEVLSGRRVTGVLAAVPVPPHDEAADPNYERMFDPR